MNRSSFVLSAALTLGACVKQESPASSPVLPPSAPGQSIAQSIISQQVSSALDLEKRLNYLLAEQKSLRGIVGITDPEVFKFCCQIHGACMEAFTDMSKRNIPADVMDQCAEALADNPGSNCVDNEMVKRGMVGEMVKIHEFGNRCLYEIMVDCPENGRRSKKITSMPEFAVERIKQDAIQERMTRRASGDRSQSDWKAHDLLAEKITNGEAKKLRESFDENPTREGYRKYMEARTRLLEAVEKCSLELREEGERNPEIAELLEVTKRNLLYKDSNERQECADKDPEYLRRSKVLDTAIAAYAKNPTPKARIEYLQAEISKFARLVECVGEK